MALNIFYPITVAAIFAAINPQKIDLPRTVAFFVSQFHTFSELQKLVATGRHRYAKLLQQQLLCRLITRSLYGQ